MVQKHSELVTVNGVPCFADAEEEALFWETHSPIDYPDYWEQGLYDPAMGNLPLPFPTKPCNHSTV